jgi:hypothetical protein
MNIKLGITALLLLFVVSSVAYLVVKETKGGAEVSGQEVVVNSNDAGGNVVAPMKELITNASAEVGQHKIIAYYFYGNKRCVTCRKLEAYAKEVIDTNFAPNLESGNLEWTTVNVDLSENEHFNKDFELFTRSVVLVEMNGEEQVRWKNLEDIWDLVGDKDAYFKYIESNVDEFLKAI